MSSALTVGALAGAGVATVANETSSTPEAPVSGPTVFTLTAWQTTNLQEGVNNQQGITGADLNTMLPMPAGTPQLDDIIGGWVIGRGDSASVAAAALLGDQGWAYPEQVVFPTAILTLFMADYLQHASSPSVSPSSAHASGTAWRGGQSVSVEDVDLVQAPCSTIQGFVDTVLDKMFSLLKVSPTEVSDYLSGKIGGVAGAVIGTVGGWLASFWNHAVDLAEQAVKNVLKALTQPVLNVLAAVVGGLGIITTVVSYLKAWKMPVTADPALNKFSVDPGPSRIGRFTVAVDPDAEIEDWPPQLKDCAKAIDVTLPSLSRAGAPVVWTIGGDPGVATSTQLTGVLDGKLTQVMTYETGHESAEVAKNGTTDGLSLSVTVKVRRTEVDQLRDLVTNFIVGKLPGVVAPVVKPILDSYVNWATGFLDILTAVTGHDTIVVTHHIPKPTPTPPACASGGTTVPAGTYSGPISGTFLEALHVAGPGQQGSGQAAFTGTLTIRSDGVKVYGTIAAKGPGSAVIGKIITTNFFGGMKGNVYGSATDPMSKGSLDGESDGTPTHSTYNASLHVTRASCASVSGDMVAMLQEITKPVAQYLTLSGNGAWTIPRKN